MLVTLCYNIINQCGGSQEMNPLLSHYERINKVK